MSSSDDSGYVHDPGAFDEDGNRSASGDDATEYDVHTATVDREFDWRGWVVVGMIVVTFVLAPLAIYLWPPGVGYHFAMVVLPLVPAVLLAITAVWATTRP